jgi:hypothetical protein
VVVVLKSGRSGEYGYWGIREVFFGIGEAEADRRELCRWFVDCVGEI